MDPSSVVAVRAEYVRGFNDALEMVLLLLKRVKSLDDARQKIEELLGTAVERKIEELARELGYPLTIG